METLQLSQHVHIVPRSTDTAVYHKLFGNLCILGAEELELLRRFQQARAPGEIAVTDKESALIAEFKDRFFLVPAGSDERSYVEEDKKFRSENLESGYLLRGIQLVLTNDCNLGCSYCFQETIGPTGEAESHSKANAKSRRLPVIGQQPERKSSGSCGSGGAKLVAESNTLPAPGADVKKMSPETAVETVRNAIYSIREAGNRHLSIEFFGGEPMMNWPAIEAVLTTFGNGGPLSPPPPSSDAPAHPVQLFYSMTTNATMLTDERAQLLRRHGVTITVSFDSPKNVNRLTKRGGSADHLIIEGLEILARNDSILTFNTVVSVGNVDSVDVEGLLEAARRYKVRAIGLILDLDIDPYNDRPRMAKVIETVLELCVRAREYGIPITGYWHQIFEQIIGAQQINLQKGYKTCAAEGCKLSFEPNGDVTHCKTTEMSIGHASRLDEVFKSSWYRRTAMKAYETTPYCRGCMVEGFCSGLCMGTLRKVYNDVDAVVLPACEVYRELTTKLIQAIPDHEAQRLSLKSAAS